VESWDSYDQLSLMRQSIEQELRMAREIQQSLLPKTLPKLAGYGMAACYQPAREVGGDFYDFFEFPEAYRCLVLLHIVVVEASLRDSLVSSLAWHTPPSSSWSPSREELTHRPYASLPPR
jgi:hypothetical protein